MATEERVVSRLHEALDRASDLAIALAPLAEAIQGASRDVARALVDLMDSAQVEADGERDRLRGLLREWCEYTGLRQRIRESDDPTEYETGRDLLARTDAALDAAKDETSDGIPIDPDEPSDGRDLRGGLLP
jgi:hypothetical protein